jgi:signal peptidase I
MMKLRGRLKRKRVWIPIASLVAIVVLLALVQATGLLFPLRGKCPDWLYPTIPAGGQVLAESVTYRFRDPHRGEIVRFHVRHSAGGGVVPDPNSHAGVSLRVIGVPGDAVAWRAGHVYVNGKKVDDIPTSSFRPVHVGRGEYFVLGDNRSYAQDSRSFGLVPRRAIFARLVLIVWPFGRFGVPSYDKSLVPSGTRCT